MTITAQSGPVIEYGTVVSASGNVMEYNEHRGPSLTDLGNGMLDPRSQYNYGYNPGQGATAQSFGFWGQQGIVDYTPGALSSNNIALSQSATAASTGYPLSLTLTASGVTTTSVSITAPETGKTVSNLICIDTPCGGSSVGGLPFGQAGSINIWNPNSVCGRGITITVSSSGDIGGSGIWTIAGRDVYGFKVTETITATATQIKSAKTYKYISAITASSLCTSTGVIVGTQDLYGFPMLVQHPAYLTLWVGHGSSAALVTAALGTSAYGSSLVTATSTNGDVRGTYNSTLASGSSMRIVMFVTPTVANLSTAGTNPGGVTFTTYPGIFGATQFSSV